MNKNPSWKSRKTDHHAEFTLFQIARSCEHDAEIAEEMETEKAISRTNMHNLRTIYESVKTHIDEIYRWIGKENA